MKPSNVSTWCIPYLSLLSMLTRAKDTFTAKMYQMRFLLRIGFLEIFSNLLQATIITTFLKSLQGITQKAYFLLEKNKDVTLLGIKFNQQIFIYTLALQAAALFDLTTRYCRNYYFSKMAEELPLLTEEATNEETFTSRLASNSITTDRKTKELPNTIRWYYLVFQGLIMGPIEILTYLCTLGPTLLASITLLSFVAALIQNRINNQGQQLRDMQSNAQADANNSTHENHAERIRALNKIERDVKDNKTFSGYIDILIRSLFQAITTLICAYFVFNGSYDLAMMSAQASAAPAAMARITKYLSLLEYHTNLKSAINDRLDVQYLQVFTPESLAGANILHTINEVEAHKTLMAIKNLTIINADNIDSLITSTKCDLKLESGNESILFATRVLNRLKNQISEMPENIDFNLTISNFIGAYEDQLNDAKNLGAVLSKSDIEYYLNEQRVLRESFYKPYSKTIKTPYLTLYISCPIILLGLIFTPLPTLSAITALFPATSAYNTAVIGFASYIALSQITSGIQEETVDATVLTYCISAMITLATVYFGFQLYNIATYSFLFNNLGMLHDAINITNARIIISVLATTYPTLITIDKYCLQSLMFSLQCFGTWVSQEAVTLLKLPHYAFEQVNTLASKKIGKTTASPWFAYLPQFGHLGRSFGVQL